MEREEAYYGSVEFSHFLPTMAALRYLNCCRTAGWHKCNKFYHLKYEKGVPIVFLIYTVKGTGQLVADLPDIKEAEATDGGTAARTDGVIRTKRKRWVLTEGTLCVVPADRFLEYGTWGSGDDDFWEFYWLNLDGDYVHRTAEKLWQDGHVVHACRNTEYFRKIFHGLLHVTFPEKNREMEHSGIIQDLLQKLLAEMVFERKGLGAGRRNGSFAPGDGNGEAQAAFTVGTSATGAMNSAEAAELILEYIQENYARKISLEEFSKQFFLSKNQIIRIFRKRTGYAPYEYIKHYRLLKACELLQGTEITAGEVGSRVGYCNNSHFAAQFRECYGMTPTEYRSMFAPQGENRS